MSDRNLLVNRFNILVLLIGLALTTLEVRAQSQLVKNLKAGKNQTLVAFGTSLTYSKGGNAWLDSVVNTLNRRYGNHLKAFNSARGGKWSTWGVQNLEDSVIKKKPDVILIEFGMNDAYTATNTSLKLSLLNLNYIIDRVKLYNSKCEIILQVMNMPIGKAAENRPHLLAYNELYRTLAKKRNLLLIDHYPNWEKLLKQGEKAFLEYVPDGIHPNENGARIITAPYILQKLEEGN